MALRKFKNRSGARWALEVPGPGMNQATFDARVDRGVYVLLPDDPGPDGTDSADDAGSADTDEHSPVTDDQGTDDTGQTTGDDQGDDEGDAGDGPDAATAYEVDMVAGKSVADTLAWAAGDDARRAVVLEREKASDKPRETIVKRLSAS